MWRRLGKGLFGGGGIDVGDEFLSLRDQLTDCTECGDFSCYVLKENGHSISLLFGQYANKACVARWKICSADDYTDADLPVSITMMDSSLAKVSAASDARDVVLNRLEHFMPCSDPGPDGSAINQHCSTADGVPQSAGCCGGVFPSVWICFCNTLVIKPNVFMFMCN